MEGRLDASVTLTMIRSLCSLVCALLVFHLFGACGTTPRHLDASNDQAEIQRLQQRLLTHPDDAAALRDLGVLYLQTGRTEESLIHLERAYERDRDDPEATFFYGLALENVGETSRALSVYETYTAYPRLSPYRRRMAGRYRRLLATLIREDLHARVAAESEYEPSSPHTVAVFPFLYQSQDEAYALLGRGLSELVSIDLTKISRLRVVERVRLQALLDELQLAQAGFTDTQSAPRAGRLLGAGRVVGGGYAVLPDEQIHLSVSTWVLDEAPAGNSRTEALRDLFVVEKDIVFGLLQDMEITPTPQERAAIEHIPTRSLEAFLAYCRGLHEEDAGRYDSARRYYDQAATLDPEFSEAVGLATEMEGFAEVGDLQSEIFSGAAGPGASLSGSAPGLPAMPGSEPASLNLLEDRLQNLGASVGSLYVPGTDAREPAAEATTAGTDGLPPPPRPPTRDH